MSRCHTCKADLHLPTARLHAWDAPDHDIEFDPEEVWAERERLAPVRA